MSLHRLLAIARKEFHHVTRDARTLFLVTVAPAFLLLTLAYVFSLDAEHFNLIVLDQDRTDLSRRYVADLTCDGDLEVVAYVESYEEIDAWLQAGRAHLALVIPPGTQAAVQARRPAPIQVVVDGVDAIAANQAIGQLSSRTNQFVMTVISSVGSRAPIPLQVRSRAWYNPPLKSLHSMVPGLIALVLTMPALALSLALTREKELGSFERLASTPMRGTEYILGKMLTYIGFGLISALPVVLVATLWFRVPFRGNLLDFAILTLCYYIASLGVSVVVANFVKSQQVAMLIVILVFFVPSFFLAGLILPVDTSSPVTELTAYMLPATHFIAICRGVFLKGLGVTGLLSPALNLLGIGAATLTLSLTLFRKWMG